MKKGGKLWLKLRHLWPIFVKKGGQEGRQKQITWRRDLLISGWELNFDCEGGHRGFHPLTQILTSGHPDILMCRRDLEASWLVWCIIIWQRPRLTRSHFNLQLHSVHESCSEMFFNWQQTPMSSRVPTRGWQLAFLFNGTHAVRITSAKTYKGDCSYLYSVFMWLSHGGPITKCNFYLSRKSEKLTQMHSSE